MDDQEISRFETRDKEKQIALLLGWRRKDFNGTIVYACPGSNDFVFGLAYLPPWLTDDGTAIKALEEWCRKHGCNSNCEYIGVNDEWGVFIRTDPTNPETTRFAYNQSLARAIVEAMIAAHKSMEGTK